MKSVLISIRPKWVEKIARGEKTIEIRKTTPKETPFKCYIYCSYGNDRENYMLGMRGKVIGEFICDEVYEWKYDYCDGVDIDDDLILDTCLDREDINIYAKGKPLYGWHISDLKIYDKPKELSEFRPICKFEGKDAICALFCLNWKYDGGLFFECTRKVTRPPQSYMYVEGLE